VEKKRRIFDGIKYSLHLSLILSFPQFSDRSISSAVPFWIIGDIVSSSLKTCFVFSFYFFPLEVYIFADMKNDAIKA
jgi:hypothetical protein